MNVRFFYTTFILFIFTLLLPVSPTVCASDKCPELKDVQGIITKIFRRNIRVKEVTPARVNGLCRVEISFQKRTRVLYIDSSGAFLVPGDVYTTSDGVNITREAMMEINRFTPPQIKTLDRLAAFSIGHAGPVIYFVTDPQCPYCKKAEKILETLAESGLFQAKVLLFPLKFHKGAKEECISIICDKKGLEGLNSRYRSENQCDTGKKLVEDTVKFLQSKGITGTPTYIFSDGRFLSGVMQKEQLLKKLGIDTGAESTGSAKKK